MTEPASLLVDVLGTFEAKWESLGEDLRYGVLTPQELAAQWSAEAEPGRPPSTQDPRRPRPATPRSTR